MLCKALGFKVNSPCLKYLAHSPQGSNIDSLLSHQTTSGDLGEVFPGTAILDGCDEHGEWVLARQQVDDLEGLPEHSDGVQFFAGVPAVEIKSSSHSFDDGAQGLSELLSLIPK
jgi:hypothetical protein